MALNIAIVDADETILDSVRLVLESEGWCVRIYATGEDFLADLNHYRPDCLIIEPHLPGLSGAEVARSMARNIDHLPIIGLTAWPVSPLTTDVVNAGACVMLTKPVTSESLVDNIRVAVGGAVEP